jgi:hypothetical protein
MHFTTVSAFNDIVYTIVHKTQKSSNPLNISKNNLKIYLGGGDHHYVPTNK